MQFWPPDDEQMCSKHVEAWNKLIVKQNFFASSWLITEVKKSLIWSSVDTNSFFFLSSSGTAIWTRHVKTKHRTATPRVSTECNQFKGYERFILQFTTSNGYCKRRRTIQLTASHRTEQRCNIQPLLHNLSELQKVKTNQTSPSGQAGSNNIPEIYTTTRATLRSCNYTKHSPANDNISVPYFPIEYLNDNINYSNFKYQLM